MGWVKTNVDAAVDIDRGFVGYGVVYRDSDGEVLTVGVDQANFSDDVAIAEGQTISLWYLSN